MQGHDSVEINADVELGGSEQLFNLMVAARLAGGGAGKEPQICVTLPILRGLDGDGKWARASATTSASASRPTSSSPRR